MMLMFCLNKQFHGESPTNSQEGGRSHANPREAQAGDMQEMSGCLFFVQFRTWTGNYNNIYIYVHVYVYVYVEVYIDSW
jgi:hypothetical protein